MSSNAASGFGKAVAGFGKAVTGFGKAVTGFGKAVTGERGTNPSTLERKPEWVLAPSVSSSSHHRRAELEPGPSLRCICVTVSLSAQTKAAPPRDRATLLGSLHNPTPG